jgi:hypothetical protein
LSLRARIQASKLDAAIGEAWLRRALGHPHAKSGARRSLIAVYFVPPGGASFFDATTSTLAQMLLPSSALSAIATSRASGEAAVHEVFLVGATRGDVRDAIGVLMQHACGVGGAGVESRCRAVAIELLPAGVRGAPIRSAVAATVAAAEGEIAGIECAFFARLSAASVASSSNRV